MSPQTSVPAELEALVEALSDRYAVEGLLGRGSTAMVWLARDLRHDRPVALKVLHDELGSAVGLERFQREIHLAAKLQHPHILPLFDSGAAAGRLWYAMPFIAAGSLGDRIARDGRLPAAEVAALGAQLADALNYAHGQGVIHRDLKPENIMLSSTGHGLLADFGIARALEGPDGKSVRLTETGVALGTPLYMSPEQASGEGPIDGRTDVYALAGVLFEALTGTAPFPGESVREVIVRRLTEPPPSARRSRPDVPPGLDAVLKRGLARQAEDRFATAGEFAEALRTGQAGRRAGGRGVSLALRIGAGFAVCAAAVGIALRLPPARPPDRPTAPVIAVLPFKNLGQPTDQYFADGLTEEITSRLAGVTGIAVISRTSAGQYRDTRKALRQVGQELGAAYLLEGSVRWDRNAPGAGGRGRVRVTPQLIRVTDDVHLWAQAYDAELAEVFKLQSTIAERVADALEVTLKVPERAALEEGGTSDPDAYDYYLRGNDYLSRGNTRPTLSAAVELYQKAVARDPRFALAFARLSNAHSQMYWYGHDGAASRMALSKRAADSTLALAPDLPEAQIALGYYYYRGFRDYPRALEHFEAARRRQPNNGDLLAGIGFVQRRRGRWAEAIAAFSEAAHYDPRSNLRAFDLGSALSSVRRFAEAEHALERAITLGPEWAPPYAQKAQVYLAWRGDVPAARAVLRQALSRMGLGQLTQGLVSNDQTAHTLFTSDSISGPVVDALTLGGFTGDTLRYYFLKAESARFRRLATAERAHADSLRAMSEARLRKQPGDPFLHSWLGIAYAALGRRAEAIGAARRAVELMPPAQDALQGPYFAVALAQTYMMVGEPELAIQTLEPLLEIPSPITRAALRADPIWTPLRGHPQFRRLIEMRDRS